MLKDPSKKYRPFAPIDLPNRQWPTRQLTTVPVWCSTDLRDGNQALFEPMSRETKKRLFKTLVAVGLKEIEVGFPSASDTDFQTVRDLIEQKLVPDDVTIMVITQAREELIRRTVESLRGARRAIVHVYNATAPVWRRVVFGMSVPEVMQLITKQVGLIKTLTDAQPETEWVLEYSPETFSMTELPVALEACNAATRAWDAGPGRPIIINLPTTVENATPNIFADQIEWMSTRLERREHVVLSVHTHNDRGTGVAAAELGMLAGAQRVEGCLFGNGERSGNVDLVTLALNFYSQGIHPGLDFSDINSVAREVEAGHAAAHSSAASVRRRSRVHRVLRLAPGRHQERHGGAEARCALGSALHPGRSGRPRPHLRQRDPREQPVRQGRHRLSSRARLRRRDAAAHAGGVQRAGAARDGCVGNRDDLTAALGAVREPPISPPTSK